MVEFHPNPAETRGTIAIYTPVRAAVAAEALLARQGFGVTLRILRISCRADVPCEYLAAACSPSVRAVSMYVSGNEPPLEIACFEIGAVGIASFQ